MHEHIHEARSDQAGSQPIGSADTESRLPLHGVSVRQQILIVYMATSSLTSEIIAWSLYDSTRLGVPPTATEREPPYRSAFAAMQDGWCILSISPPMFSGAEAGQGTTNLKYRVVLERRVDQLAQ